MFKYIVALFFCLLTLSGFVLSFFQIYPDYCFWAYLMADLSNNENILDDFRY